MYHLEKENYLGVSKQKFINPSGISLIQTEHNEKTFEGWHSHKNAHITLFLKGGTIEKRKNETISVSPGTILFYHSDESHLNQNTIFPSKNLNIEIDEKYYRPAEVDILLGDHSKAKNVLGWTPKIKFEELVKLMMRSDLKKINII